MSEIARKSEIIIYQTEDGKTKLESSGVTLHNSELSMMPTKLRIYV